MNSRISSPSCPARSDWQLLLARVLSPSEQERLLQHLSECAACRRLWENLQAQSSLNTHAPVPDSYCETTPGIDKKLYQAFSLSQPHSNRDSQPMDATLESLRSSFSFLDPPLAPGELGCLGPYRIRGVLGEGGMGVVFDAEDTALQRRIALKILKPELASNLVFRQRFLQEGRTAAALPPEYIVTIYQVGMIGDIPFLAMQYLEGESLEQRLKREQHLSIQEAIRIGIGIASGLAIAHERGLIHRDIKPANIWLENDVAGGPWKRVKLLDFGLARPIAGSTHLTATGLILGTPQYLAPEQASGYSLDGRCDLFSLGCVLYRILSGNLPFQGKDPLSQLTALAIQDPPPMEDLVSGLPLDLAQLVRELLAKDPAQRPSTAGEVVRWLQAIEAETMAGNAAPTLPVPLKRLTHRVPTLHTSRSRWLWWAAGSSLAMALLLTGFIVFLLMGLPTFKGSDHSQDAVVPSMPTGAPIKVGILQSLSGSLAVSGSAVTDATMLAIDELNQKGGVLGRPIEAVVVDGHSDEQAFPGLAEKLIREEQVCTIFGCWTSASRKAVRPIVEKYGHLLLYPLQYEGLEESPNIVYLGAAPNQQILPGLRYATGILRKRRLFLVGSDYVFPHTAHAIIRADLKEDPGVRIVGEKYLPLGSGDVKDVITEIVAAQPDLILNTINGDTNGSFFRALRAAGVVPPRTTTMSFSIGENELRGLDTMQMVGDYAIWSYFQSIDRPENEALIRKFRARYGPQRVISDPMETAYFGVHLWAQAVEQAKSTVPEDIRNAIRGQAFVAPEGPVHIDAKNLHTWRIVRAGRIVSGGQFEIMWSSERPVQPYPFPPLGTRAGWERFLSELYRNWGNRWEAPKGS